MRVGIGTSANIERSRRGSGGSPAPRIPSTTPKIVLGCAGRRTAKVVWVLVWRPRRARPTPLGLMKAASPSRVRERRPRLCLRLVCVLRLEPLIDLGGTRRESFCLGKILLRGARRRRRRPNSMTLLLLDICSVASLRAAHARAAIIHYCYGARTSGRSPWGETPRIRSQKKAT